MKKIELTDDVDGDDRQVTYHYGCDLRCFLLFFGLSERGGDDAVALARAIFTKSRNTLYYRPH